MVCLPALNCQTLANQPTTKIWSRVTQTHTPNIIHSKWLNDNTLGVNSCVPTCVMCVHTSIHIIHMCACVHTPYVILAWLLDLVSYYAFNWVLWQEAGKLCNDKRGHLHQIRAESFSHSLPHSLSFLSVPPSLLSLSLSPLLLSLPFPSPTPFSLLATHQSVFIIVDSFCGEYKPSI